MKKYKVRIADALLAKKLRRIGAVLVQGPKWCGKTTTSKMIAKSSLYMADPKVQAKNLSMAEVDIQSLLLGKTPRLIDEWQLAPKLWDAIRYEVDMRDEPGQFILTGSAVPPSSEDIHHTGTGRFSKLTMRPMSLFESGESSGTVSIEELFGNKDIQLKGIADINLETLAFLICRGGWPSATFLDGEDALSLAFDYYDAIVESDISRADNTNRNVERAKLLMRSYSRSQGTQTSLNMIMQDMQNNDTKNLSENTIYDYINALKKIFVIEDMTAWNPNLRSKTAIRSADTRYFVDPSIAVAALGLSPKDLINDLNTMGFLFETMCVRDLRVYADAIDAQVYHYRDKTGLECDAVIHLRNGSYALIEIKLGGDKLIDEGAKNLISLSKKIDTDKMKAPSFLMVLTGVGQFAYKRPDGVMVVPVGCLKN